MEAVKQMSVPEAVLLRYLMRYDAHLEEAHLEKIRNRK